MKYDVFISYSRSNELICDDVATVLRRLGLTLFIDRDIIPGSRWQDELEGTLRSGLQPIVMILATRGAAVKPDFIRKEIELAVANSLRLVPVEIDSGSTERLGLGHIQYIDALRCSQGTAEERRFLSDFRFEDDLRLALHGKLKIQLDSLREESRLWVERTLPPHDRPSFWGDAWRNYFEELSGLSTSLVLVAAGGSGKSVLLAHYVHQALSDAKTYPVLFDEQRLREGAYGAAVLLGARSPESLTEHSSMLKEMFQEQFIFIVDALDRIGIADKQEETQIITTLNLLASAGVLLISCRKEMWELRFAGRIGAKTKEVHLLEESTVAKLIPKQLSRVSREQFQLLRLPVFLDIALMGAENLALPDSVTRFLAWIRRQAIQTKKTDPVPNGVESETLDRALRTLSQCQLDQMHYDVNLTQVRTRLGISEHDFRAALDHLKRVRLLEEISKVGGITTIRLRHDLLDNFGIVLLLNSRKLRQEVYRRAGEDCGWSVLMSLIQTAHDDGSLEQIEEVFQALLDMLDRKKFGDEYMARAWAATYVLRGCFGILRPLIVDCLNGQLIETANPKNPECHDLHFSSIRSTITQEAASSLASAFEVLDTNGEEDSPRAISVLAKWLSQGALRFRFIEALSKFHHSSTVGILEDFARNELTQGRDARIFAPLARALGSLGQDSSIPILEDIYRSTKSDLRSKRFAARALNDLRPSKHVDEPDPDEEEILEGLRIWDARLGQYSDWRMVEEYAKYARDRMRSGTTFSPSVKSALIEALKHDQTFVKVPVAQGLELLDEAEARDALLYELLKGTAPANVRDACVNALAGQLARRQLPLDRQLFRYLLLFCARTAAVVGSHLTASALTDLAVAQPSVQNDWLIDAEAVEVINPFRPSTYNLTTFNVVTPESVPIKSDLDPMILLTKEEQKLVGEGREKKYRFTSLRQTAQSELAVEMAETTWEIGAGFHYLLLNKPERVAQASSKRWIEPVPLGPDRIPGLAVVHCIVVTSDGTILLAKRSDNVRYAPGHWSASFEEQITEDDLKQGSDVAAAAARRGFLEEFGIKISDLSGHMTVLSALLEMNNLNLAIVLALFPGVDFETIALRWSTQPRPSHYHEATELKEVDLQWLLNVQQAESTLPLHPTSQLRGRLLFRWLAELSAKRK